MVEFQDLVGIAARVPDGTDGFCCCRPAGFALAATCWSTNPRAHRCGHLRVDRNRRTHLALALQLYPIQRMQLGAITNLDDSTTLGRQGAIAVSRKLQPKQRSNRMDTWFSQRVAKMP